MTITVTKQEFRERLEELLTLAQGGAEVVVKVPDEPELRLATSVPPQEWIWNMHPGAYIAPDFADPLPDEYWEEQS